MKVLIKEVDNPKAKHRVGQVRELEFLMNRARLNYTDDSGRTCITSKIKEIIIKTQNTEYVLEVTE